MRAAMIPMNAQRTCKSLPKASPADWRRDVRLAAVGLGLVALLVGCRSATEGLVVPDGAASSRPNVRPALPPSGPPPEGTGSDPDPTPSPPPDLGTRPPTTDAGAPVPGVSPPIGSPPNASPPIGSPQIDAAEAPPCGRQRDCPASDAGAAPDPTPPAQPAPKPDAGAEPGPVSPAPDTAPASPPGCRVGEVHCLGRIPQMCGADGKWVNGPACVHACEGGCVNRFAAVSAGRGSPTNGDGLSEFVRNGSSFFSKGGDLIGARGFNVAVLDPRTGAALEPVRNFDPWVSPLSGTSLREFAEYLNAIEPGRLVLVSTCDDAGITNLNSCEKGGSAAVTGALDALRRLGSREIGRYCSRGAFAFAAISGEGRARSEKLSQGAKVTAEITLPAAP